LSGGSGTGDDPFSFGLKQAVVFDPFAAGHHRIRQPLTGLRERVGPCPDIAVGRWYPTLRRLADGRVRAVSGL